MLSSRFRLAGEDVTDAVSSSRTSPVVTFTAGAGRDAARLATIDSAVRAPIPTGSLVDLTIEDPPIEDVIEPFLIQLGLIARTARGRCLNGRGWAHLGLTPPAGSQSGLFDPGTPSK